MSGYLSLKALAAYSGLSVRTLRAYVRNIVRGVVTSPKSHQQRRVDITPQLATALLAWRRVQRARWMKKGEPMPLVGVSVARGDGA